MNDDTGTRVLRGLLAGLVAGTVASFAMDRFQAAANRLSGASGGGEPATEQAADAVARQVAGREIAAPAKPLAGQAVHYLFGAVLGAAYGVAAEFEPSVTKGGGLPFGIAAATVFDEAAVPAAGLGDAPWRASAATTLYAYASHLVFAGTMELTRRQTAATLAPAAG